MRKGQHPTEEARMKMRLARKAYFQRIGKMPESTRKLKSIKMKEHYASLTDEQRRKRAINCKRGADTESRKKEMSERFKRLWKDEKWVEGRKTPSFKNGKSQIEEEVGKFVQSVTKHQVDFKWKGLENPHMELDIYIHKLRLGIEVNGSYWHNRPKMKKLDELKKTLCEKAGIKLLTITDTEWGKYEWSEERKKAKDKILKAMNGGLLTFCS